MVWFRQINWHNCFRLPTASDFRMIFLCCFWFDYIFLFVFCFVFKLTFWQACKVSQSWSRFYRMECKNVRVCILRRFFLYLFCTLLLRIFELFINIFNILQCVLNSLQSSSFFFQWALFVEITFWYNLQHNLFQSNNW